MKILLFLSFFVVSGFAADSSHLGDEYSSTISGIWKNVSRIHEQFEVNKIKHDKAEFLLLIDEIKEQKLALGKVKAEINGVLSSLVSYHVLDKVYLEFARITAQGYEEALNQIAFEILGQQAGVSEFKVTYVSESINLATAFLKGKFDHIVTELADVDNRMNTIMSHRNSSTDLFNELRILNELSKTVEEALKLKVHLFSVFSSETEKAMVEGKELNILQKCDVDLHIMMIDWLVQFVRTYQELIQKLIGY